MSGVDYRMYQTARRGLGQTGIEAKEEGIVLTFFDLLPMESIYMVT